jgi:hypothetical protein
MPLVRRTLLEEIGGFGYQSGLVPLAASEGIEFYIRLLTSATVTTVPGVLVKCRDHPGLRESAGLHSLAAAQALDAVVHHHEDRLAGWPREQAHLLARCAARYVSVGERRLGYQRFRSAMAIAPARSRLEILRRYAPFMAKDAANQLRRRPVRNGGTVMPGSTDS